MFLATDLEIYDRAVWAYLSSISDKIVYSPTSTAIQNITKKENFKDNIPFTFISYYRAPSFDIDDPNRAQFTTANLGDMTRLTRDTVTGRRTAQYVCNIPVNISYQVDIWSAKATKVQEMAIALVSKLYISNPVIHAPMNPDSEDARFHIIDIEWTDNSDLEVENDRGRLYRHTINFTIDARIKLVNNVDSPQVACVPVDIYED